MVYERHAHCARRAQVTAVNAVEDDELKEVNEKEVNELEDRLKAAGVPFER